jgi:hypothetical protein
LQAVTDIDPSKQPDVLLDQAAEVMADIIDSGRTPAPAKPAKARPKPAIAQRG